MLSQEVDMTQADIGLAMMGQDLVLKIADHGYSASVYNRSPDHFFSAFCILAMSSLSKLVSLGKAPLLFVNVLKW